MGKFAKNKSQLKKVTRFLSPAAKQREIFNESSLPMEGCFQFYSTGKLKHTH